MTSPSRAPRITARAVTTLERVRILENPYLADLSRGSMDLELFRRTQEQFFFAVTFFSRPMAALVGRIPDPRQRIDILHNLVEEHGEFQEHLFHHTTFKQFLRSLGSQPEKLDSMALWPALRAFNSVLTGVACMGIIEHAFAGISAVIGQAVVRQGWVPADQLVHYRLHAAIDERHAEEFFAVIEPNWDNPSRRYYIEQGLELGAYIFDRLYRDMLEAGRR
jgi:pyrroloquinoline-quinone synthase